MTSLSHVLRLSLAELERLDVSVALVGGLAVSVRTEPRFTRDIDLAVAVQDDNEAERLVHSLAGKGFDPATIVEQTQTRRLATVRLHPPATHTHLIDLLFASSGIEPEVVAQAESIEVLAEVIVP